jgi:hypothetical protein
MFEYITNLFGAGYGQAASFLSRAYNFTADKAKQAVEGLKSVFGSDKEFEATYKQASEIQKKYDAAVKAGAKIPPEIQKRQEVIYEGLKKATEQAAKANAGMKGLGFLDPVTWTLIGVGFVAVVGAVAASQWKSAVNDQSKIDFSKYVYQSSIERGLTPADAAKAASQVTANLQPSKSVIDSITDSASSLLNIALIGGGLYLAYEFYKSKK